MSTAIPFSPILKPVISFITAISIIFTSSVTNLTYEISNIPTYIITADENVQSISDEKITLSEYTPLYFENDILAIQNQNTFFYPVKELAMNLGVLEENIKWNGEGKILTIVKDDVEVIFQVGNNTYLRNEDIDYTLAPEIYNEKMYIEATSLASALDYNFDYDIENNEGAFYYVGEPYKNITVNFKNGTTRDISQ